MTNPEPTATACRSATRPGPPKIDGSSNRSTARTGSPGGSEPCATRPGVVPGGALVGHGGRGDASPVTIGVGFADEVAPGVGSADGAPVAGTQPTTSTAMRAATSAWC